MVQLKVTGNIIALAAAGFGLVCWLIALAGVGACHSKCAELSTGTYCTKLLQPHWWGVWFNFFLLIVTIVLAVLNRLSAQRFTLMAFFTACVSVTMSSATSFLQTAGDISSARTQQDAAAAGFVMLSLVNFIIITVLGSFMGPDAVVDTTAEVTFKRPTATAGPAPPPPAMPGAAATSSNADAPTAPMPPV